MECVICDEYFPNIPLLRCGHALCNVCYCNLKIEKITKCIICCKELIRGTKKNTCVIK